jgi:hypothetical protein
VRFTPRWFGCALFVLLVTLPVAPAPATTVIKLTDQELVDDAALIVECNVTGLTSSWNPTHDQIFTLIDLQILNVLKGTAGPTLQLRILGGQVDSVGMAIVGMPSFSVGEHDLLYLVSNPQAMFPIVGFNQGKFTLITSPSTGEVRVQERNVSRDAFIRDIRAMVRH